ncbi:MAG TPA: hypothetical protein DCL69_07650 [Firmicutes bacterium]|jgi:hypothetical protein|nr:hypothetical protein [Bacillota bacterium]
MVIMHASKEMSLLSTNFPKKVKNINVNVNVNKSEDEGPPGLTRLPEILSTLQPQLEEASPEIAKLADNLSNAIAGLNK